MINFLDRWHRRLGIFLALPILLWCISGLTHPLMTHVATTDAARQSLLSGTPHITGSYAPIQRVLRTHNIQQADQIRLVTFNGQSWYQVQNREPAPDTPRYQEAAPWPWVSVRYFSVETGAELVGGDSLYARWLARYFAGMQDTPVAHQEKLTAFDAYYPSINRLLPAHRIRFDRADNLEVVVDTTSSRLAAVSDRSRNALMWAFRTFHTWDWLGERHSPLRVSVLAVLITATFTLGLFGLILYGCLVKRLKTKTLKLQNMNAWHRTTGVVISLSMLGFASSGLHQLWGNYQANDFFAFKAPASFSPKELVIDPIPQLRQNNAINISLARLPEGVFWQFHEITEQGKTLSYQSSQSGHWLKDGDSQYANYLASLASEKSTDLVVKTEPRQRFSRDYPEILRRLPVQKVTFKHEGLFAYYIETQTGLVANHITGPELAKTLHFLMLHKYRFLDKQGFSVLERDLIMSFLVLLIIGTTGMGGIIYIRKRKAKKSHRLATTKPREA